MESVGELLQLIEQLCTSAANGENVDLSRFQRLSNLYHESGKRAAHHSNVRPKSHISDEQLAQSFRVLQASLTHSNNNINEHVALGTDEHVPQLLVQIDKLILLAQEGVHTEIALPLLLTMDLMAAVFAQSQSALQTSQRAAAEQFQLQRTVNETEKRNSAAVAAKTVQDLQQALITCKTQYRQLEVLYKEQRECNVDISADLAAATQNVEGLQRAIDTHLSTIKTLNEQLQAARAGKSTENPCSRNGSLEQAGDLFHQEQQEQVQHRLQLEARVHLAEAKLAAIAEELDRQMENNAKLQKQLQTVQQAYEIGREDMLAKESELASLTKQFADFRAEHAHEKSCLESRIRTLKTESINQQSKSKQEAQANQTTLIAQLRDLELELEDTRQTSAQQRAQLQAELATSQAQLRQLEAVHRQQCSELQAHLQAKDSKIQEAETQKSSTEARIEQLLAEFAAHDKELRVRSEELQEAQLQSQSLEEQLQNQKEEVARLTGLLATGDQHANRVVELEEELQRQTAELASRLIVQQQQLEQQSASAAEVQQRNHEMVLKTVQDARTAADERAASLEKQVEALTRRLEAKEQDFRKYEKDGHLTAVQRSQLQSLVTAALRVKPMSNHTEQAVDREQYSLCKAFATKVASWSGVVVEVAQELDEADTIAATPVAEREELDVEAEVELIPPSNIIFLELGAYQVRTAFCTLTGLEQMKSCHTIQALPVQGKQAVELVASASIKADEMFQFYREHGRFVGEDAWHCCFEHPDPALRGSVRMEPLICDSEIQSSEAMLQLLQRLLGDRVEDALVIVALSPGVSTKYRHFVLESTLEQLYARYCSLLPQPSLALAGLGYATGIYVNIGSGETTVVPVYEGFVISDGLCSTRVGGETLTRCMALLICGKYVHNYTHLLPRRQEYIARLIKEKACFVVEDFDAAVQAYGALVFEQKETLLVDRQAQAEPASSQTDLDDETREQLKDIQFHFEEPLPDGTVIDVVLDRERFHCAEVLFQPPLFEECKDELGLIELIRRCIAAIESSCRSEVSEHIVLGGGTCKLPNLLERVQKELGGRHKVQLAEHDQFPTAASRGIARRLKEMQANDEASIMKKLENVISYDEFSAKGFGVLDGLV